MNGLLGRRPLQRLKNLLIYIVLRGVVAAAALLPLRAARALGAALGSLGWRVARRERERALAAARGALGAEAGAAAARASFAALGRSAAEASRMSALRRRFDRVGRAGVRGPVHLDDAGAARLQQALDEGRGVVYVTAHLGNWELMAAYLAWRGFPIWTVARESYDPRLTAWIDRWRAASSVHAILRNRTNGGGVTRRCYRTLRAGRVLGLLLDQDLGDVPSIVTPFLGRPARVALGPAELALRSGAAVVGGFIARDAADPSRHRIRIDRIAVDPAGGAEALARQMSAAIETAILRDPGQWVWLHDRWGRSGALAGESVEGNSNFRAGSTRVALQP